MVEAVYGFIGSLTLIIIMLQIDNTIISLDFLDEHFVCNLNACKGICCVEGDAGAPLEEQEIAAIQEILPLIWDDIPRLPKKSFVHRGFLTLMQKEKLLLPLSMTRVCACLSGSEGVWLCSVEKAFREDASALTNLFHVTFILPGKQFKDFVAVNYHRWSICSCAVSLGNKEKVPVYQFLKEPLIRNLVKPGMINWLLQLRSLKDTIVYAGRNNYHRR